MTTGLAVGIGLGPFATKQPEGSSNALDVITSSNGAYWVVAERGKNLLPVSDDMGGTGWGTLNGVYDSGTLTFTANNVTAVAGVSHSNWGDTTAGKSYVFSAEWKYGNNQWVYINVGSTGMSGTAYFDIQNGTTGTTGGGVTASAITDVGDGWYRCEATVVASGTASNADAYWQMSDGDGGGGSAWSGTETMLVRRPQIEEGSSFTSYEETTGTALAGALLDQTGGGRHLLLPGGSANPVLLDHDNAGTDYFWFPNTTADYLSVPDSAALSITGDIDIRVAFTLDNYATGSRQGIIAKGTGLDYMLNMEPAGELRLRVVGAGNYSWNTSSAVPTPSAGNVLCVWCSLDVDNGASGNEAILRYKHVPEASAAAALDSTSGWTTMANSGTTGVVDIRDGTGVLAIGAALGNYGMLGKVYRAIIKDGIDGTTVLDVNAADADPDATTFTEASSNAATVTINRSSTGYCTEVVDQPGYAFATDDYLYATDDALFDVGASDEFTAGLVVRVHGTPGSDYARITKKNTTSGTDAGWSLQENTAGKLDARVADGTASPDKVTASAVTDHVLIAASIVRDATTVGAYDPSAGSIETVADSTTGTLANAQQLRIGADGGGADFLRGFVVGGFFLKDTARTAAQIDGLSDALITANGGTP